MKHFMRNRFEQFTKDYLKECFDKIDLACSVCPNGVLAFGNTEFFMKKNENGEYVPFMRVNGSNDFEMYGDDGYTKLEDIGHLTDICVDFVHSKAAGEKLYSSTWNEINYGATTR